MRERVLQYFSAAIAAMILFNTANAQTGLCPANLDFEMGDFTGWECRAGQFGDNPLPLTGPIYDRHTIISWPNAELDPFGFFPILCPNGSKYSVRLGNHQTGAEAESISYTYTIPSDLSVFSILLYYAIVLESPGHTPANQPRFLARIIDVITGDTLTCVNFEFVPPNVPGGFQQSIMPGNLGSIVLYKDWTPISINLNAYIGRTIKLEFVTKDCAQFGHAGYAYIDVSSVCNGVISGNHLCPLDTTNSITMTAPYGFQTYTWYSDTTFSQIIGTSQTLTLSPRPTVGSVFPIVVKPYPGFGCRDTLFATIDIAPMPIANAGPDMNVCKNQMVQIGSPPLPGYTYSWTPASQVGNPTLSNPMVWADSSTSFIVTATDILTGCSAYDTTVLSVKQIDTTIQLNGKDSYCVGDQAPGVLSVSNASTSVQWYDGPNPIAGATNYTYQPVSSGNFWAQILQQGCVDSTRTISVAIHPLPIASFYSNSDTGCITKNSFLFTNTSTVSDNSAMNYLWKFSDGSTQQTTDATKIFSSVGMYNVQLVTSTSNACKDSTQRTVQIFPNGNPDFTYDSACTNHPVVYKNLSNENNSPLVNYVWDFDNGGPLSSQKDPMPVTYTNAGKANVTLQMTTVGCENDPKTISKPVLVNAAATGIHYTDITVPQGSSHYIHARSGVGDIYNWRPQIQLSKYNSQYTEFFATNDDVKYLIDITDPHTCVTTDTIQMFILKKPGFYLPTAFTPNGDGLNDVIRPYLIGMKGLKSFSIYNRWGGRVFYSERYGEGWNGKFNGIDQAPGVYVWILVFTDSNDKTVTEKGTLTLIR